MPHRPSFYHRLVTSLQLLKFLKQLFTTEHFSELLGTTDSLSSFILLSSPSLRLLESVRHTLTTEESLEFQYLDLFQRCLEASEDFSRQDPVVAETLRLKITYALGIESTDCWCEQEALSSLIPLSSPLLQVPHPRKQLLARKTLYSFITWTNPNIPRIRCSQAAGPSNTYANNDIAVGVLLRTNIKAHHPSSTITPSAKKPHSLEMVQILKPPSAEAAISDLELESLLSVPSVGAVAIIWVFF
ncbi:MAG: hypothetical protein Q9183_005835 [Haloplaca sp. 2 TL-2023]